MHVIGLLVRTDLFGFLVSDVQVEFLKRDSSGKRVFLDFYFLVVGFEFNVGRFQFQQVVDVVIAGVFPLGRVIVEFG